MCATILLLALPLKAAAADYKDEYKMSVVVGSKLPWGQGAERFAELVKQTAAIAEAVGRSLAPAKEELV